ncbi:S41 family peptidase [Nitrosophilus alvini]|uniref:S41 family peptidase n=1 Tax=Nitrosophilus alvini TaxID=2714855 RepID=UPI001F1E16EC|nr:S41 family peptidase [Nitrosophilus alvini]
MKKMKILTLSFIAASVMGYGFIQTDLFAKSEESNLTTRLHSIAKFTKVVGTVEKYYVDELTIEEIINKAIAGLLSNLDAHSSYLDKKHFKELKIQTEGEFGGLGITVGIRDGALTVIAPIEGTPADKAGLKSGDIILKINDKSTLDMTLDEAVNLMRGKPGTKIKLTIVRKNEPKPIIVEITRDIIKIQSVYAKHILNEDILYLRVTSFDKKVKSDVEKFIKENEDKTKGIILDLRNNPGGLLDQAVELVDLFVDEGVIVSQKGRVKDENREYLATKPGTYKNIPIVVLVNEGSASASEIVSGSLQDHKRAIIVGEKTFGKGSVQVILPIDKEEAVKLTIARYYLPSGRTIQALGVTPDIIVHPGKIPIEENGFAIKEAELKKHLKSELEKIEEEKGTSEKLQNEEEKNKKDEKEKSEKEKDLIDEKALYEDAQLKSAVDILKALIIVKNVSKNN